MDPAHKDDGPEHEPVQYDGKEFKLESYMRDFESKGLIEHPKQLEGGKGKTGEGFKPPGQPRQVGKRRVFPHFG